MNIDRVFSLLIINKVYRENRELVSKQNHIDIQRKIINQTQTNKM